MRSYPTDVVPTIIMAVVAIVFGVIAARLLIHQRSRCPRLRMLTGTPPQRTALRLALQPVVREFLPLLERAGHDIRAIVVVPTLSGSDGQALTAEIEELGEASVFIIRLAHRAGSTLRQPDDVAGALAEDLLYLYRHAAAVTVIRQTGADVGVQSALPPKPRRNGLAALPHHAAQNEAEEKVISFKPNPLGPRNGQSS
ncbi:MAG: hypothetical protein JO023_15850 [Chloroflexi bacterium]|nr:hypothetical protein [Chloroflexota bacterium]